MYTAQDIDSKTQAQLVAILNDELGYTIAAAEAKKLKNTRLREMVLEIQAAAQTQEPEVQVHPEVESQLSPEEITALEEKLVDVEDAVPSLEEVHQEDDVMSPQELLVEAEEWFVMVPGQNPVGGFASAEDAEEFTRSQSLERGTYSIRDKQYVGTRFISTKSIELEDKLGQVLAEGLNQIALMHEVKAKARAGTKAESKVYFEPNATLKPCRRDSKNATAIQALFQGTDAKKLTSLMGRKCNSITGYISEGVKKLGYGLKRENGRYFLLLPNGYNEPLIIPILSL